MSDSRDPSLRDNQPMSLKDVLKNQRDEEYEDCTPCRVMGSAAFTMLGIYTFASGYAQIQARQTMIQKSGSRFTVGMRKMGIVGLSATMVGLGVYRLVG